MTEDTGHISESDSHVSWNALSVLDIKECTQSQFLEVLTNLGEICTSQSADERTTFIAQVYRRMLHTISRTTNISLDRIVAVLKQLITYSPQRLPPTQLVLQPSDEEQQPLLLLQYGQVSVELQLQLAARVELTLVAEPKPPPVLAP
ncbi:unnamed protein product [Rotaria socialis]|uniref:Uncharacterized protein n=2 Tax=Rotaria TaxID=231623 RepID=A0A821VHM0_9BILA|nr:unnamed protein product [Rotaria socialis]